MRVKEGVELGVCRTCVAAERILKQTCQLGVPVRHMRDSRSFLIVPKSADDVAKRKQPAVDVYALLEPVALCARALDALAACEVDKVELGRDVVADTCVRDECDAGGSGGAGGRWERQGCVFRDGFGCGRAGACGGRCWFFALFDLYLINGYKKKKKRMREEGMAP